MSATPAHIGPYQILREIGRGGMGIVYLARDAKLDRDIAIKSLPEDLAENPDRLSRFEREAKLLASLSHPNIAAVHGLEEVAGRRYLVMEYVEGEELSARLDRGPIPLDEALPLAIQIASALEAAHAKGVIHRDLKPANIRLTPEGNIKVLDFGLAKTVGDAPSSVFARPDSPTIVNPAVSPTLPGVILGTAGYLSPEQARGRAVDRRTDIFSFGCVFYEMLTGRQPFPGETATDSIGAVLHREPEWSLLPAQTPEPARRLLRHSLAKDQSKRLRDMGDARLELDEATTSAAAGPAPSARSRAPWIWAAALIITAGAAAIAGSKWGTRSAPPVATSQVTRLSLTIPADPRGANDFQLSPDGRLVGYRAMSKFGPDAARFQVYIRPLDSFETRPLPGTDGAYGFCFSPDSQSIAFTTKVTETSARTTLMKVQVSGGPAVLVYEHSSIGRIRGPVWLDSGDIAVRMGPASNEVALIPSGGGEPRLIWDSHKAGYTERPEGLAAVPGGKFLLVTQPNVNAKGWRQSILIITVATGEARFLIETGAFPKFASPTCMLYAQTTGLLARAFDPNRGEFTGAPMPMIAGIRSAQGYASDQWDIAPASGTLTYVPGGDVSAKRTLALVDLTGRVEPLSKATGPFESSAVMSPDGKFVCGAIISEAGTFEIFLYNVAADTLRRVSTLGDGDSPVWTPDSSKIIYSIRAPGEIGLVHMRRVNGGDTPEVLFEGKTSGDMVIPTSMSPDGKWVLCQRWIRDAKTSQVIAIALESPHEIRPVFDEPTQEGDAMISPDGKWIAYLLWDEQHRALRIRSSPLGPAPAGEEQVIVSTLEANTPLWAPDGSMLIFREGRSRTMAVDLNPGPPLTVSRPRELFDWANLDDNSNTNSFTPDGKHIVFVQMADEEARVSQLNVILNWSQELKSKLPK